MMKHLKITAVATIDPPLPGESTANYRQRVGGPLLAELTQQVQRIIQTLHGDTQSESDLLAQVARRFVQLAEAEGETQ